MKDAFFWGFAALALIAAWRVFRTDSMVRASFFLLASFIAVAAILLLLSASYLGFALIFMMTVEMVVMALFMVMFMMNPAGLNPMNMLHQPKLAAFVGFAAFAVLAAVVMLTRFPVTAVAPAGDPIAALGRELLGGSMLVFESAGVTLLAAMVGSVVLSSRSGRYGAADEGSRPPGLAPDGEPAGRRPAAKQSMHGTHHEHREQSGGQADHRGHSGMQP